MSNNTPLVESYPWATQVAHTWASRFPSHYEDLQSAGILGYVRAAAHFDDRKGSSFRNFCSMQIKGAILDEVRHLNWAPRAVYKEKKKLKIFSDSIRENLQREPTTSELAENLGVSEKEFDSMLAITKTRTLISLDEPASASSHEDGLSLNELIPDPAAAEPDKATLRSEEKKILEEHVDKLPFMEAYVIRQHYLSGIAFQDIALALKVHPSRISQIHHKALSHLRGQCQKMK